MAQPRIFIRLYNDTEQVSWALDRGEGEPDYASGTLLEASVQAAGKHTIVLVPGTDVLLVEAEFPSRNRQRILNGLPYMLEDDLIDDIDDQHFAIGAFGEENKLYAAIVSRSMMDEWMSRLREAHVQPHVMLPDMMALPHVPGQWTLLAQDHGVLVRTGAQSGCVVDKQNAALLLGMMLDKQELLKTSAFTLVDAGVDIEDLDSLEVEIDNAALDGPVFSAFVHGYHKDNMINLLQGDYSRSEKLGRFLRPWRVAACFLAGWFVVSVASLAVEKQMLSQSVQSLEAEMVQVYKKAFPNARNVPRPRFLMEQKLKQLRGAANSGDDEGFLQLLAAISGPVSSESKLELLRVTFKDSQLSLALNIPSIQRLESLKDNLSEKVQVEIISASQRNNVVEARLRITGKT